VISFNYQEDYSKRLPVINETFRLSVNNYAQVTGKRIFINPNILSRSGIRLSEDKNRKFDVDLKEEYYYLDSIQIVLPDAYELESAPKTIELKSKFGRYKSRVVFFENKITYYRELEQYSGRFSAMDYADVIKFYNEMYDADRTKIVLVKKN